MIDKECLVALVSDEINHGRRTGLDVKSESLLAPQLAAIVGLFTSKQAHSYFCKVAQN